MFCVNLQNAVPLRGKVVIFTCLLMLAVASSSLTQMYIVSPATAVRAISRNLATISKKCL